MGRAPTCTARPPESHFGVGCCIGRGGSNDKLIGYQCLHCTGSEHHLLESAQQMEIVALEADRPSGNRSHPVDYVTVTARHPPPNADIGDTGRWPDALPLRWQDRRFELPAAARQSRWPFNAR